ncbi:hypothetical protein ABH935_001458 [Catenulispora sp. GAS73]|uniref:hypothetical protein n=1 Tax=Catenulispora sp. GAS73 TaxID=3156269 RepID=UPI003517E560
MTSRVRAGWPAWILILTGSLAVVLTAGLGATAAVTVHDQAARLADVTAAEQRLAAGGLDDDLTRDLLRVQQDEVALFRTHVDSSAQDPQLRDPSLDLYTVDQDLTAITHRPGVSTAAVSDADLIQRELAVYTGLEAMAVSENRQAMPVGAAYLREASGYLRDNTLDRAEAISQEDRARLLAQNEAAAGYPRLLVVVAVVALAYLVVAQAFLAWRTHRVFNVRLLTAGLLVVLVAGAAVTALLISRHRAVDAGPSAKSAADLTAVQRDVTRMGFDDQLTLSDFGEDCTGTISPATGDRSTIYTYPSTCAYEQDVLDSFTGSGTFSQDLETAVQSAPDDGLRAQLAGVQRSAAGWTADEMSLPTLQNLAAYPSTHMDQYPRYDPDFLSQELPRYTSPDVEAQAGKAVTEDFDAMQQVLPGAIDREWAGFARQTGGDRHLLGLLASIPVLLGAVGVALLLIVASFRQVVREHFSSGEDDR